jgi:anti-anti-sigma factor
MEIEFINGHRLIHTDKNFTVDNLIEVKPVIMESIANNENVVLILKKTAYMDSLAIGFITNTYKKLKEIGKKLYLVGPTEDIYDLLEITGLMDSVTTFIDFDHFKSSVLHKYKYRGRRL